MTQIFSTFLKCTGNILDKYFIPLTKSKEILERLRAILNYLHKDIKFALQSRSNEKPFLDVMVHNKGGKLETDIYLKEKDSKKYLLFTSCHPRHSKLNFPYNFEHKIRTIISEQKVFDVKMNESRSFLLNQIYPENSDWNRQNNAPRTQHIT